MVGSWPTAWWDVGSKAHGCHPDAYSVSCALRRLENRSKLPKLVDGDYAHARRFRHAVQFQSLGDAGIQEQQRNHLGMPLPKGGVSFYRRDDDGQLEFTGENEIDHTPKDELIRIYTGNAFDLAGGRHRVDYKLNNQARWVDESFEIKVRNHKTTPAEVRIVEHLCRWTNWDISKSSDPFKKVDAQTAVFTVEIPPDGEKVLTYQVHYSW